MGSGVALAAHMAFSERARRQVGEIVVAAPRFFLGTILVPAEERFSGKSSYSLRWPDALVRIETIE